WLRAQLAVRSEFACDDAAVRCIGDARDYARILVEVADAVRHKNGRLQIHALGVDGGGALNERIARVLRNDEGRSMTWPRKVLISSTVALFIIIAVACRNESVSLPALGDLSVEEPRAAARENTEMVAGRDQAMRWRVEEEAIKAAQTMNSTEAA